MSLSTQQMDELERFKRERNAALLSLNEAVLRRFFMRWNGNEGPEDPEVFWRAVHKARTGCRDLPIEVRRSSKAWLNERGSVAFDDGELA